MTTALDPVAAAPAPATARVPLGKALLIGAATALALRVAMMTVAWAAAWLFADGQGPATHGFFDIWLRWDARHILGIAEHGYSAPESDPHATEWWPALPLAVRALMTLGISPLIGGLLVTFVASSVAFAYLYRTAEEDLGPGTGRRAVTLLALFPTSLFLIAPYTESLFLAGAIGAFYYARRERWWFVGPFAALAMGSRLPGLFVFAGLGIEFLRQRPLSIARTARAAAAAFIGLLPLAGYMFFLSRARGDALYFVVDAEQGWGRHFVGPWRSLVNTLNTWDAAAQQPTNWLFAWRVELVASAAMVAFVVWAFVRREWGYAAFMGVMAFVLLSTTWYFSHPRMLLMFFPGVLFATAWLHARPRIYEVVVPVAAVISTLGVIVYTRGAWFF